MVIYTRKHIKKSTVAEALTKLYKKQKQLDFYKFADFFFMALSKLLSAVEVIHNTLDIMLYRIYYFL